MVKKGKHKRLILLDSHAILHRAYHAMPGFVSSAGEPTGALYGLVAMLLKTIKDFDPDYIVACFDLPEPTHRHQVFEEYKAGRAEADDELVSQLERARDVFGAFNIPIYDKPGFEADDMIGTIVEQTKDEKDLEVIIVTGDMDTLQLVSGDRVRVFTLRKGINDTVIYNEKAVEERFGFGPKFLVDYKGLRGDPSDNIPGVKGIGEKTATDLITKIGGIDDIYKTLKNNESKFEKAGFKARIINLLKENEAEAEFSKELGTIRLDSPIKFELGKRWEDNFDMAQADSFLSELGFRALRERMKEAFGDSSEQTGGGLDKNEEEVDQESLLENKETLTEKELKEAELALWLLDSTKTRATEDDFLLYAKTKSLKEARKKIMEDLKDQKLDKVLNEIELPLVPILKRAENRGILVDQKVLKDLSKKYHKVLSVLEKKIWKEAGEEFNINSPKQLGEILFDKMEIKPKKTKIKRTSTGAASTNATQLEKMRDDHPIIKHILEYREYQKLLSTYIDNIPEMLDKNSRLHTTFVQTGTTTGRLSSRDPNLQNIPIRSELGKNIRGAFVAAPGHKLVALDYSQIDLRSAAILSGDQKLVDIFKSGEDIHAGVAAEVFDVPLAKVDYEMRRRAKVINFGIIYGMGVNALRAQLGTSREEAQEFHNIYFAKFEQLSRYMENVKAEAKKLGYTETYYGRRRHFPGLDSPVPFIKAAAERMAMNAPIQGTTADIIKIAMINADKELAKNGLTDKVFPLLQIHDELIYEVVDDKVGEATEIIKKTMENVLKTEVPLEVTVKSGDNWGNL